MLIKQALKKASTTLSSGGIEEAPLETGILLRHILDLTPAELHIHIDKSLSPEQTQRLDDLVKRRLKHEPIAYITGHREFFGLDFYVNQNTLIPRPETELLVEIALEAASKIPSPKIVDVGTGCGAIAISLAKHLPHLQIYAVDISGRALEVARSNCLRHGVSDKIELLQGNLLQPVQKPIDIIVANLPYITDSEMLKLSREILLFEPGQALEGGPDGLKYIKQLLAQSRGKVRKGGTILLEIGRDQGKDIIDLIIKDFPESIPEVITDLGGNDRIISLKI